MSCTFLIDCTPTVRKDIFEELKRIGCCTLCTFRLLGLSEQHLYRNAASSSQDLNNILKYTFGFDDVEDTTNGGVDDETASGGKQKKCNPCVSCLGLLQHGIKHDFLDQIISEVVKSDHHGSSYFAVFSMPTSILIRAYSIWFHLLNKFPQVYSSAFEKSSKNIKPEVISLKNVWKWICVQYLKDKINPNSLWLNSGDLTVHIHLAYSSENEEFAKLAQIQLKKKNKDFYKKGRKGRANNDNSSLSKSNTEAFLSKIESDLFTKHIPSPPSIPNGVGLKIDKIESSHLSIFVAGRYCKFSRELSQTPWVIDGERKTATSIEELISQQLLPVFVSKESKFSSSGREDVDVRCLGQGRPFVCEMLNPKRTVFTQEKMREIQKKINESTSLVSVRDLQIVDKKELDILRFGAEDKTKMYCALCYTPGTQITREKLNILNETQLPLILYQKTPIRVLHRRSLATRNRSNLEMRAELVSRKDSIDTDKSSLFKLFVKTQAGTYVKEFVHGDFELLGVETDILSLDVTSVDVDWPPTID